MGFGAPRSRRGDRGRGRWDAAAAGPASSSVTVVEAQRRPLLPLLPLPLLPWGDSCCCCCCIAAPLRPAAPGFLLSESGNCEKEKKKKNHRPAQCKAAGSEPALPSSSPLRGSAAPPVGEARPPGGGGAEGRGPGSVWPDSGARPLAAGLGGPPHCPLCPGPSSAAVAPYPPILCSHPGKCRETPRDRRRFRGSLGVGVSELRGTWKRWVGRRNPGEGLGEG